MIMTKDKQHRATIETIINSVALASTAFGTNLILTKDYFGFIVILFGVGLEYFKYMGRAKKLW